MLKNFTINKEKNTVLITLDSGKTVKVESFEYSYTYGGVLCGLPNEEMNRSVFEKIKYPSNWGPRKTLIIKPSTKEFENELKSSKYSVWLTSDEPIEPQYHGSELVVIWLDDIPGSRPIEEIISKGVKAIDWEANAQDFQY